MPSDVNPAVIFLPTPNPLPERRGLLTLAYKPYTQRFHLLLPFVVRILKFHAVHVCAKDEKKRDPLCKGLFSLL